MSDLRELATNAYVWGSALVGATRVRQNLTQPADPYGPRPPSSAGAPLNNLGHQRQLSDPEFTVGVAPNVDTLYSLAWLDLGAEPFVFETPDFGDRYYTFQLAHADTGSELSPGQRSHGPQLPPLFIHGPGHDGAVPGGMLPVASRTRYFMIAGRILVQPDDPADAAAVRALQERLRLRPLARWQAGVGGPNPVPPQRLLPTAADVDDPDLLFLHQLGVVLVEGVVTPADRHIAESLAPLGLGIDGGFDSSAIPAPERGAVVDGLHAGEELVEAKIADLGVVANGWSVNVRGPRFGGDYLLRAAVAKNQIYVLPADEAIYPVATVDGSGEPLDGRRRYRLSFLDPPPVDSFWSLTVYAKGGRLVANPLHRYAIGDRTPGLQHGPDGGLTILLQHAEPDRAEMANWLPTPAGQFHLMLRLYGPLSSVRAGSWVPPPIEPLDPL